MYNRYKDYYLVNDDEVEFEDMDVDNTRKCKPRKIMCILFIIFVILLLVAIFLVIVVFPLVFMNSLSLQQQLIFTHWNLQSNKTYFEKFRFPGLKNRYVTIKDIDNKTNVTLGLWHILPLKLAEDAINNSEYDYYSALKNSNYSVLLYFHGTGEDRSDSERKYQSLRYFFHVIVFDYRSYADSSKRELSERSVVNDCIQIYQWLKNRTESPIFVWGQSLGTALATNTLAQLKNNGDVAGLILESPFTTLRDELYHHPYVKYLAWLPWFDATVIKPLEQNGFVFNTSGHIVNINCPIMFFHAKDDTVVPYFMSERLYDIASSRKVNNTIKANTVLYLFDKSLQLSHYFIYQDPYVIFYVHKFIEKCTAEEEIIYEGSHQS